MQNKKFDEHCNKIAALKDEFLSDLAEINLQGKSLIVIGSIILIITIISEFLPHKDINISIQFRSILASIFGFLLSSTTSPQKYIDMINENKKNYDNKDGKLDRSDCDEDIEKYNFKDGNLVQICIALVISIVCIFTIVFLILLNSNCTESGLTQLTDLMCTSIGFLLGEARINRK